ncbi:MAG: chemotaxis protein CheW [Deltaproteobacteria bacterium]|nr:chemotaxis protein CheW [Deltaproteobacteria bacterium]
MSEHTALQQVAEDQLVTFSLGGESLAFPIGLVQEIVKPSAITRVPNAPHYVEGIANLRGNILPVVNLRNRLGMNLKEQDDDTRVVVLNVNGAATGMVVDSVSEVLHVDESAIESPPDVVAGIDGQYLRGVAKTDDGKRLTLILSTEKIIPDTANRKEIGASIDSGRAVTVDDQDEKRLEEEELLVTFRMAGEEFAIDIMQVQEIIRVTEITRVPRAPDFVRGITSLRNRLLPIVDLRALFGMTSLEDDVGTRSVQEGEAPETDNETEVDAEGVDGPTQAASVDDETADARRIVVIDMDGVLTGILVDSVSEVLRLPGKSIEDPPSIINREHAAKLKAVGKLNNGERLVMLLDLGNLISADQKEALVSAAGDQGKDEDAMTREIMDEEQVVCFRIEKEEYGIGIMKVQEIIRIDEITAVPNAPRFVEGIVNLRGNVLPVLDMRTRFGLDKGERTEQNRIIVVDISGKTTGIIVDSVSEVLRIPRNQIEFPPDLITEAGVEGRYIEGIGKLDEGKRIIVLIQVDALLTGDEKEELSDIGEEKGLTGSPEKNPTPEEPKSNSPDQESSPANSRTASAKEKTAAKAKSAVKKTNNRKRRV